MNIPNLMSRTNISNLLSRDNIQNLMFHVSSATVIKLLLFEWICKFKVKISVASAPISLVSATQCIAAILKPPKKLETYSKNMINSSEGNWLTNLRGKQITI